MGILLIIDLLALMLAVYAASISRGGRREAIVTSFILWGVLIIVSTETLSLFHALGFWPILIWWGVVLAVCLLVIIRQRHALNGFGGQGDGTENFAEKVYLNRLIFFSGCLGLIALLAPPSSYDALTYHLSRVMHWIQNHTIAYYPTHIPRQLYYPAFAEYVILHFQLLSGGDGFANFVQFLSMCGSLTGVSLIARELGAGPRGQILSCLIAVTVPMGILQSSSTQTDYVETLWITSFIYFLLRWRKEFSLQDAVLAGFSLGLAINTKGIGLIFALPFLGWIIIEMTAGRKFNRLLAIGLMVLLALISYAGPLYRNAVYFQGNSTGEVSADADSLVNAQFSFEAFMANTLRNTAIHLIIPSVAFNNGVEHGLERTAAVLHVDLNKRDWSYIGHTFIDNINFSVNEDSTGNTLHLVLFTIVAMLMLLPRFRNRDTLCYLGACLAGWVFFNMILKWQPWNSRFHLPLFVLMAPIAGYVMERFVQRWIAAGVIGILFAGAWMVILFNISKPITSSLSILYPANRPGLYFIRMASPQTVFMEYQGVAQALQKLGCKNIGLITDSDEPEYLLWAAINPSSDKHLRIESILVDNASGKLPYPLGNFLPDAIIAVNDERSWVNWQDHVYQMVWHSPEGVGRKVSILIKSPLS